MEHVAMDSLPDFDTNEDFDDDEWYYSSISRFEQLQMFDFDSVVAHVDFTENDHLCVSGKIRGDHQEIQELTLPEKNSSSAFESNDLKLKTGGFSSKPIFQMKSLRNLRKIVTSEDTLEGIFIYELGSENSDCIKKVSGFSESVMNPRVAVFEKKVAFGSSSFNIHLADIDSEKASLVSPAEHSDAIESQISGLSIWDENSLMYCESQTGKVILLDSNSLNCKTFSPFSRYAPAEIEAWPSFSVQKQGKLMGAMSSLGHVTIYDVRGGNHHPVIKTEVNIDGASECVHNPMLLFSPNSSDVFSISGINGCINVYQIDGSDIKLIFSYDGHNRNLSGRNKRIINHIWSPVHENLIFSSADDGSFHSWKFIEIK